MVVFMEIHMTIRELVQLIRINSGITQKELAELSNIDQGALCMYENGKRTARLGKRKRLVDIANKAGMNIKYTDIQS